MNYIIGLGICCVIAAFFVQCSIMVHAQPTMVYVVGDTMGWTIPQAGASAYSTWASTKKFVVGDTLTFNFTTNFHDVIEVPKASYDACSSNDAIGNKITTGPANINLTTSGEHYYICTFGTHCQSGQKLAITVSASRAATPPGCSPSPASPPKAGGPTAQNSVPPPPAFSSSTAISAGVSFSLLSSIALMTLF